MHSKSTSDFLFADPSFVSGAARLLDLYCLFDSYNTSRSGAEADYKALLADWRVVGQDIQRAVEAFESASPQGSDSLQYELFATEAR
jgi:hypothetical protein